MSKCAIIINNAVICWNRPWQYGCNRPDALPSGRAFLIYQYGGIFDVLVALYFACTHPDEHDGYVYVFAFPEHYSPHSKYIEEFYTNVLEGKHIAYSRNFKVFSHSVTNDRIKAQKGGFIFFPGKEFHPINDCYYERILISKNHKREILEDLEALFQITKATLFPEKDKVAEIITNKFKGNIYTTKSVSLENEIESFFSRIDYELKILHLKGKTADKKRVMRWLRKEQDDLINYTEQQISSHISELTDAEQEKVIQTIKNNFSVLLFCSESDKVQTRYRKSG